jgi:hypothetical protein
LELEGEVEFSEVQMEWCRRLADGGMSAGKIARVMTLGYGQAVELMRHVGHAVETDPTEEQIAEMRLQIRRGEVVFPNSFKIKREATFWLTKQEVCNGG